MVDTFHEQHLHAFSWCRTLKCSVASRARCWPHDCCRKNEWTFTLISYMSYSSTFIISGIYTWTISQWFRHSLYFPPDSDHPWWLYRVFYWHHWGFPSTSPYRVIGTTLFKYVRIVLCLAGFLGFSIDVIWFPIMAGFLFLLSFFYLILPFHWSILLLVGKGH
jgi:hypothetical protein